MEDQKNTTQTAETTAVVPKAPVMEEKKSTSKFKVQITNVVATYNFKKALNLKDIAMRVHNTEYSPKRFSAVILRIRTPVTATGLIFASGKMVCTGTKSCKEAKKGTRIIVRIVHQALTAAESKKKKSSGGAIAGKKFQDRDFKIQNMTGMTDFRFPILLEGLHVHHEDFCTYEPEIFPGLIYRMMTPKIVLLIFVSGKVVLTGAKKEEDLKTAVENIHPVLTEFSKVTHAIEPIAAAAVASSSAAAAAASTSDKE